MEIQRLSFAWNKAVMVEVLIKEGREKVRKWVGKVKRSTSWVNVVLILILTVSLSLTLILIGAK